MAAIIHKQEELKYMPYQNNKHHNLISAKAVLLILLVGVVVALMAFAAYSRFLAPKPKPTTASPYTKGTSPTPNASTNNTPTSSNSNSSGTDTKGNGGTSTTTLLAPSGVFVSSHHTSLSSSAAESSVCNTTPGATCVIRFTNTSSGTVKELRSQETDAGGATYWNWKLSDIGLSAGEWKVEAVASLGAQTKTAADALNLEITQ